MLEGQPRDVIREVLAFATEVGLPVCLAQIGLEDADPATLRRVAERATAAGETIHNEPFVVDPDMVVDAIGAADALGSHFRRSA